MNYIKRLEEENRKRAEALAEASKQLTAFRLELLSAKFYGVDSDGDRKDWMSTGDIEDRLLKIRAALTL